MAGLPIIGGDCDDGNSQKADVGKSIQVCDRGFVSRLHPPLSRIFKAGIVTLAFRAKRIAAFKIFAVPVDGKL